MLSFIIGEDLEEPREYVEKLEITIPNYEGIRKSTALKFPDILRFPIPENTENIYITWKNPNNDFEILETTEARGKIKISIASWGPSFVLNIIFN
jgi:hypothetical protein